MARKPFDPLAGFAKLNPADARFARHVLVWERGTYCSTHEYTAEEFNEQFTERQRVLLLAGLEVDGCVDLEAFYHRHIQEAVA